MSVFARREVMTAGLAATLLNWPGSAMGAGGVGSTPAAVFINGPAVSALPVEWRSEPMLLIDLSRQDVGHAWRDAVPGALARGGWVAGITAWSQQYICEQFGRDLGLKLQRSEPLGNHMLGWSLAK